MRNKTEKLVACPISKSSNHDEFNDICKATGQQCPYFADEGMSVCKSKAKCLAYFAKNWSIVNHEQVAKLIAADTKSSGGRKNKYTNTIKLDKSLQEVVLDEAKEDTTSFLEDLEDALKNHEEAAKLIVEDEKSAVDNENKYTNTIKLDESLQEVVLDEIKEDNTSFLENLEDALKSHEEVVVEEQQVEISIEEHIMAIEESMKKM